MEPDRHDKTLDARNAHYMIGSLATIAPDSVGLVFKHYSAAGTVREGIRSIGVPTGSRSR